MRNPFKNIATAIKTALQERHRAMVEEEAHNVIYIGDYRTSSGATQVCLMINGVPAIAIDSVEVRDLIVKLNLKREEYIAKHIK